jgi:hypothetical protein
MPFFRSDGGNYGLPESLRRPPLCRGFFVYGGVRIESFAEIGKHPTAKLRDRPRLYRQRCRTLCSSIFPAPRRHGSRTINSDRIVRRELTEPSLPSQYAQQTDRIANLPNFVHGIDLIEHRLPQIQRAGGKQSPQAVDGYQAQTFRVA